MKLPRILGLCVCGLSALAGLFVFIAYIAQIGSVFSLFGQARGIIPGLILLVIIAIATLWLVFAAIGLVLQITKGEGAGKKSVNFGLFCARFTPAIFFLLLVLVQLFSLSSAEAMASFFRAVFTSASTYIIIIGTAVGKILFQVAKKQTNPVNVAVLKGIAAVLFLVAGLVYQGGALVTVGYVLAFLAAGVDVALPFFAKKD